MNHLVITIVDKKIYKIQKNFFLIKARDTISKVVKALSIELPDKKLSLSSRTIFSLKLDKEDNTVRKELYKTLSDFDEDKLGNKFVVIINAESVVSVMEVVSSYT